jgi:hypothetical protein
MPPGATVTLLVVRSEERARPVEIDPGMHAVLSHRHEAEGRDRPRCWSLHGIDQDVRDEGPDGEALGGRPPPQVAREPVLQRDGGPHVQTAS